jgi:ABC-type amino acid transport substrate-binding protein
MNKSFITLIALSTLALAFFWYSFFYKPQKPIADTILIVGTSADFKPMSYKDGDEIVGFDIDIIKEVASRLHKRIEFKDMPFELLIPQLQLGTIQVIAAGLTITPEREKRVLFTKPYLTEDPLIIISPLHKPLTIKEFENKRIIVNQGYTADIYLSKLPTIELLRLPTVADALLALDSGRADGFVTAQQTIKPIMEQYGQNRFFTSEIPDVNENVALAISLYYPELAEEIRAIILAMLEDGTIDTLREKWHVL